MALTKEYIESIQFEIAKQKYYNAHKVDEKLNELKPQVIELIAENENLKAALAVAGKENAELNAALSSAKAQPVQSRPEVSSEIDDFSEKAKAYAQQIVADAQRKADSILKNAKKTAAAMSDNGAVGSLSARQFDAVESINNQLEELQREQATQIMRIRQALIMMATDI